MRKETISVYQLKKETDNHSKFRVFFSDDSLEPTEICMDFNRIYVHFSAYELIVLNNDMGRIALRYIQKVCRSETDEGEKAYIITCKHLLDNG